MPSLLLNKPFGFGATLPRRYPALMDSGIIDVIAEHMRARMLSMVALGGEILICIAGWAADAGGQSGADSADDFLPK